MNDTSVSVIIPAYRAAKTIGRAVDSVLGQSCQSQEILVVDDGSPDDLTAALAPYGNRVTVIRKPNGGAASARNLGIERSSGDLIAFLDADDYWEPVKLERQLAILQQHPEVGLTSSQAYTQQPGGVRVASFWTLPFALDEVLRASGSMIFEIAFRVWTTTVVVRRQALGNHRFEQDLETAEDRDLWIRLIASHPVYFCSERLATGVDEAGSLSRSNGDRDCSNMLRVLHRHAALVSPRELRIWEACVYKRWAAVRLSLGDAGAALEPAWSRLRRQCFSVQGWWIMLKCLARGYVPRLFHSDV